MDKNRARRKNRIKAKVRGDRLRPRLCVSRSNKYIYVQAIDDNQKQTLFGMSSAKLSGDKKISKLLAAEKLGEEIAKRLIKMGIKRVAFDRSGFRYHGRVKAVAEGVRKGGIII